MNSAKCFHVATTIPENSFTTEGNDAASQSPIPFFHSDWLSNTPHINLDYSAPMAALERYFWDHFSSLCIIITNTGIALWCIFANA